MKENNEWKRALVIYESDGFDLKTKDVITKKLVEKHPGKEIRLYYLRDMETDAVKIIKENIVDEERFKLLHKELVTGPSNEGVSD